MGRFQTIPYWYCIKLLLTLPNHQARHFILLSLPAFIARRRIEGKILTLDVELFYQSEIIAAVTSQYLLR